MSSNRYAKYNEISQLPQDKSGVKIRCYTNGVRWVCPNPENKELSKNIYDQYCQGWYIDFEDYYISRKDFDDSSNWTS